MSAKTVLVVAADSAGREVLTRLLEGGGYAVATAGSDQEAFDSLTRASTPPHLVVLDRTEPGRTGWAFLKRQRCDPVLSLIPLLILAVGAPEQATVEEGVVLLAKPVRDEHLLAAARRLMGQAIA